MSEEKRGVTLPKEIVDASIELLRQLAKVRPQPKDGSGSCLRRHSNRSMLTPPWSSVLLHRRTTRTPQQSTSSSQSCSGWR